MADIFYTFLMAMIPIGELRLAIPVGIVVYGLNEFLVYFVSVVGNIVPVVFLLLFLGPVSKWLSEKSSLCRRFFSWIFGKTRAKHSEKIKKYGFWALALFTAIPLPITGGWTASLVAFLFDVPFKKALGAISLGVAIAGIIVLLMVKAGIAIQQFYGMQVLIGILLIVALFFVMFKIIKKAQHE